MESFNCLNAKAVVLLRDNIDTDQIIPGKELMKTTKTGFGDGLFAEWRYLEDRIQNPDFALNDPRNKNAKILITGRNFGCGSSREAAAWAVRDYGFRCVIARSFSGIFYNNCVKNGVLAVTLNDEAHTVLLRELQEKSDTVEINLSENLITVGDSHWTFKIPELHRRLLLSGLDAIDYAASFTDQINAFRSEDRKRRPWVYQQ